MSSITAYGVHRSVPKISARADDWRGLGNSLELVGHRIQMLGLPGREHAVAERVA